LRIHWRMFFKVLKILEYLFWIYVLAVLVGLLYLWYDIGYSEKSSPDYCFPTDIDNLYTETAGVLIDEREFEIPVAYTLSRFKGKRRQGSVNLTYVRPDFKSKLEFCRRSDHNAIRSEGNMGSISVQAAVVSSPLYREVTVRRRRKEKENYEGQIYGLHKYSFLKGEGWFASQPDDLYVEYLSDGTVVSYIKCSIPERVIVHLCRSSFNDKGLRYYIDIPFRELPNWKEQQKAAINFIDSFEVTRKQREKQ